MKTILHISDFHLGGAAEPESLLRPEFYHTCIDRLKDRVDSITRRPVDVLAVTGDFVDKSVDQWARAKDVIDYLTSRFSVPKSGVLLCPGNHDFKWIDGNRTPASIDSFIGLYSSLVSGRSLLSSGAFVVDRTFDLREIEPGVVALLLDSMAGTSSHAAPGTSFSISALDQIRNSLGKYGRENGITEVIVLSHYPTYIDGLHLFKTDEPNFLTRHVWFASSPLNSVLKDEAQRGRYPVVWLSGDIHILHGTELRSQGAVVHHTTGRFSAGKPGDAPVEFCHACTLIEPAKVSVLEWRGKGFGHDVTADWYARRLTAVGTLRRRPADRAREIESTKSRKAAMVPGVIDADLEERLVDFVADHRLMCMGRFPTSNRKGATLLWLKTDELLGGDASPLEEIIPALVDRIRTKLGKKDRSTAALVGLDVFGSMLAGLIAPSIGIPALCAATAAGSLANPIFTKIDRKLLQSAGSRDTFFVITDVVRTGGSVNEAARKIKAELADRPNIEVHLLSVVINRSMLEREDQLRDFSSVHTCCGEIDLVYIEESRLPRPDLLPPTRFISESWTGWPAPHDGRS